MKGETDYRDALTLAFERELLPRPTTGEQWMALEARPLPAKAGINPDNLICEQGFRPLFLDLQSAGFSVEPVLDPLKLSKIANTIIFPNRSRAVNEANLTRAWNATPQGGRIIFAGAKSDGAQSLRKWLDERVDVEDSFSKYHALVFWAVRNGSDWAVPDLSSHTDGYTLSKGMFSADGPDVGSILLAEHFDGAQWGHVADFGTGWGYLPAQLLKNAPKLTELSLFEADHASLAAARENVAFNATHFHWCDIIREGPRGPFDWIIMNPPFHTGRSAQPELGQSFIRAAARALPTNGRLLMVANRNLPYEQTLAENFRTVENRAERDGFKVLMARR